MVSSLWVIGNQTEDSSYHYSSFMSVIRIYLVAYTRIWVEKEVARDAPHAYDVPIDEMTLADLKDLETLELAGLEESSARWDEFDRIIKRLKIDGSWAKYHFRAQASWNLVVSSGSGDDTPVSRSFLTRGSISSKFPSKSVVTPAPREQVQRTFLILFEAY